MFISATLQSLVGHVLFSATALGSLALARSTTNKQCSYSQTPKSESGKSKTYTTSIEKANNILLEHSQPSPIDATIIQSEMSPLVRKIENKASTNFQSLVIGIAGGSGSGKTTLSKAIVDELGRNNIAYISHDSYYKDLSHLPIGEREVRNFDDPDALDTLLLAEHVDQLKAKKAVEIPVYNFSVHSRADNTETLHPRPIILVEGILIFTCPELLKLMDIKIFVDTDDDIRLIRRMERDVAERGRSVPQIIAQYLRTVRPMHLQHVQPSKKCADIIVPFGLNSVALDLVISKLKRVLHEAGNADIFERGREEVSRLYSESGAASEYDSLLISSSQAALLHTQFN